MNFEDENCCKFPLLPPPSPSKSMVLGNFTHKNLITTRDLYIFDFIFPECIQICGNGWPKKAFQIGQGPNRNWGGFGSRGGGGGVQKHLCFSFFI